MPPKPIELSLPDGPVILCDPMAVLALGHGADGVVTLVLKDAPNMVRLAMAKVDFQALRAWVYEARGTPDLPVTSTDVFSLPSSAQQHDTPVDPFRQCTSEEREPAPPRLDFPVGAMAEEWR